MKGRLVQPADRRRNAPRNGGRPHTTGRSSQTKGAALIVALWTLLLLSLMIGSFAYDMHIEAAITSQYRKRVQADALARAGIEYARFLLAESFRFDEHSGEEALDEALEITLTHMARGLALSAYEHRLGAGRFLLTIEPEQSRRNIHALTGEDWIEILDQAGVPSDRWDELIACYQDWVDPHESHRLLGAGSDDPFYVQRGYPTKNAPLDTVDELLLIKGFTPALLYGGPSDFVDGETLQGIAAWLTVWAGEQVNVNAASREVLLTIPGLEDYDVDAIIRGRAGLDGEPGTLDDGYQDVGEVMALLGLDDERIRSRLTTAERSYVRVTAVGEQDAVRSVIGCVLRVDAAAAVPVFWREGPDPWAPAAHAMLLQ